MQQIFTLHFRFLFLLFFIVHHTYSQQNLAVQKFLTDTAFTAIAVNSKGQVFAGTSNKGLVFYDGQKWQNWNGMFSPINKAYIRQLAVSNDSVWIASSGYVLYLGSGAAGNNMNFLGGVHLMGSRNNFGKLYYKGRPVLGQMPSVGPPTRNILGIYVDTNGNPWVAASYHDSVTYPALVNYNARYHYAPGAVGRFDRSADNFSFITGPALPDPTGILIGVGNNYKDDSYSIGKRRTCRSITQVGNEMWVGTDGYDVSDGNTISAGILRYDLAGNYISKYDENNTLIPFGLTNSSQGPWAMYQDAVGRAWVAMNGTRGLAVMDTNGVWTHIGLPSILNNGQIRANAISGNSRGEVFFGTNSGLLVYKGKGALVEASSYILYTTADGLSSNAVTGVSVAKDETIWLATSAGVNKIIKGDLVVYNLFRDTDNPGTTDNDAVRRIITAYDMGKDQELIDKDTLYIAADGSRATIFKWTGSNPSGIEFRIKDGAVPTTDTDQYGKFVTKYLVPDENDSIRVQYYHPSYIKDTYTLLTEFNGKNVRLQVVDVSGNNELVLLDIPVKFVLPPVLLLHGIWSDGSTWKEMKEYLLTNGLYRYKPFEISTPSYPNNREFELNRWFIPGYIDDLIKQCSQNRISAGKVDIVAHSMGGILSRLYLQEGAGAPRYNKNVHKLITINTPHSGSPLADIVDPTGQVFKWVIKKGIGDPEGGALSDLKVEGKAIRQLLNGPDLNKNVVPSHAIHSTTTVPLTFEIANATVEGFINAPLRFSNPVVDISVTAFQRVLGELKRYLMDITGCSPSMTIQECLNHVFGGDHDLIVADISQIGGMNDAQTLLEQLSHIEVNKSNAGSFRVLNLLRADAASADFSMNGFHPVKLNWSPATGTQIGRQMANDDSIRIVSPSYGAVFNRGDSVHVVVRGTDGVNRALFAMGYENGFDAFGIYGSDSVFSFKVPDDAVDKIYYKVFGFGDMGEIGTDSSYIQLASDPNINIDSVKIVVYGVPDEAKVVLGDSIEMTVIGYYSDGMTRVLGFKPEMEFTTLTGSVGVTETADVKGLVVGFDELKVTYLGFSDSVQIEVVPVRIYDSSNAGSPTPVKFEMIKAQFRGTDVLLTWNTSSELNNSYFEVEYSSNGVGYSPVGRVQATNVSYGSAYSFVHMGFQQGKNFYRIKQFDIDGGFSYSPIVVALVVIQDRVAVYPNPAQSFITIDFSGYPKHKAKQVRITNLLGQVVVRVDIIPGSQKENVTIDRLPSGIYGIEVLDTDGKKILKSKVIKNR